MSPALFANFMLVILVAVISTYFHFKHHFSGLDFYKSQTTQLTRKVERERLNSLLAQYQLTEMQQEVAVLWPHHKWDFQGKDRESYERRSLASIVSHSRNEKLQIEPASSLFERAKRKFRRQDYFGAADDFSRLIDSYPLSVHVIKSHFLLIEGSFKANRFDRVVGTVEKMVTHYPESELTGFALLRLGQIYEVEDRPEDAIDLYKLVLKTYHDQNLLQQARTQLKAVNL